MPYKQPNREPTIINPENALLMQRITPYVLTLLVALTLLNSNAFGAASLIAFFFYAVLASAFATAVYAVRLRHKQRPAYYIPPFIVVFLLLAVYVFLSGAVTGTIGLVHYYWSITGLLLAAVSYTGHIDKYSFFKGIAALAFLESLIVVLQACGILPVPNRFFLCTGTWANPNVTAMFLALSLFGIMQLRKSTIKPLYRHLILFVLCSVVLSLILLQCRSAILAALVLLLSEYGQAMKTYLIKTLRFNAKGITTGLVTAIVLLVLIFALISKPASTKGRWQVWQNTIGLIGEKPLFGYGFGQFEREYNLYAAALSPEQNDHVNMAYNDFLELAAEGGIIAVALWCGFLLLLWRHCSRNESARALRAVLIAFILLQITNFGFQAIPATVLFIIYAGLYSGSRQQNFVLPRFAFYSTGFTAAFISMLLLIQVFIVSRAFYQNWQVSKTDTSGKNIAAYRQLMPALAGYAIYHENYGDAWLSIKNYPAALRQYQQARQRSSNPGLLSKSAYCYQMLHQYDSSESLYKTVQAMQPHRFLPREALLRLYLQKCDTAAILLTAKQILSQPVKIRSRRVQEIKAYAKAVADSCLQSLRHREMASR
jgi:O-antigen polymerase